MARRAADYGERRTDGYLEPLELYVLGTSHVSEASAADVRRVLTAVRPQSVVVEVRTFNHFVLLIERGSQTTEQESVVNCVCAIVRLFDDVRCRPGV